MKAVRVERFGDPEVMVIRDVDDLVPRSDQVVVEIKAAGVNPVDTYIRAGQYPTHREIPYTPGFDGAGVVKEVGSDVKHYHSGDKVYVTGSLSGTYAQQTLCLSHHIFPLPDEISFEQGAAIGVPYATAYRALFTKAKAVDKETVLIHGASGGVGLAALQLAKKANFRIIATAGSPQGLGLIREQGAQHVLDHSQAGHFAEIMRVTEGRGVDVILEMLANANLGEDLKILARCGRVVVIGSRGKVTIDPRDAMSRDTAILGMLLMNISPDERLKICGAIEDGLQNGQLTPVVGRRFVLAEAPLAHQAILEPGMYGKIVLIP